MADQHPQPPSGFQRPGLPGAGNILDPAVRGELREQVHAAVPQPAAAADPAEAPKSPAAEPAGAPRSFGAGPFPHGDVDLRGLSANVPPEPIRPRRGRAGRRFYFLDTVATAADAPAPTAAVTSPPALKPG